jgi:hypothetical protein
MPFFSRYVLPVFGIGIFFYLVQSFNTSLLSSISYNEFTYLIYLPAGIVILAVAIYGWIGILGITLGWVFCHLYNNEKTLLQCLELGLTFGVTAYTSLLIWQWYHNINNYLDDLTSRLVISLVLISAVVSAFIRYVVSVSIDPQTPFLLVFSIGMIGDLSGSFIVLYAIKGGIIFFRRFSKH